MWFRKLCHFYKILNEKSPSYQLNLISNLNRVHNTRNNNTIAAIHVKCDYFKNSFFLLLYLSGANLIGKLETQEVSQFLK